MVIVSSIINLIENCFDCYFGLLTGYKFICPHLFVFNVMMLCLYTKKKMYVGDDELDTKIDVTFPLINCPSKLIFYPS